jgi:hypothetical protein
LLRYRLIEGEGYKFNVKRATAFIERARRRGLRPDEDEVTATVAELINVPLPVSYRSRQGLRGIRELASRLGPPTKQRFII